jgi:hypothetical protein
VGLAVLEDEDVGGMEGVEVVETLAEGLAVEMGLAVLEDEDVGGMEGVEVVEALAEGLAVGVEVGLRFHFATPLTTTSSADVKNPPM